MFVIFGIGSPGSESYSTREYKYCENCHNTEYWKISRTTNYISLFFINVIPLQSKYYFHCPICHYGKDISREEYERLKY